MTTSMNGPAYRICTPRLVVRCLYPEDALLFKTAVDESLDHLRPWMSWTRREPEDLEAKVSRLKRLRSAFDTGRDFVYGLFDLAETRVLGAGGLHTRVGPGAREIGYWIHKDFTNKGLATEAASALVRVGFEVDGLDRIEIHCDPRNERSATIPRKLGFDFEATLRLRERTSEGRLRDMMVWTLFAQEYPGSPAGALDLKAYDVLGRRLL